MKNKTIGQEIKDLVDELSNRNFKLNLYNELISKYNQFDIVFYNDMIYSHQISKLLLILKDKPFKFFVSYGDDLRITIYYDGCDSQ